MLNNLLLYDYFLCWHVVYATLGFINMKVVIVDYGLGNLRSVAGAVERVGYEPVISNEVDVLEKADKLILPGVGAFGDGMSNLNRLGLVGTLNRLVIEQKKPILGICLGFQLMARDSHEFGHHQGLNWIDASVIKIITDGNGLRVPHVGWNDLRQIKKSVLFDKIPEDALFYYVHSFHARCDSDAIVIGECEHGVRFTAAIQQENIYATQFHPEKSQLYGLTVLKNYLNKA